MPQSLAAVYLHVIFSTKHREPGIAPDVAPRLYRYFAGTARENGCRLLSVGGMPDHVHLLVSIGREITVAGLVRTVKAGSSRWIHDSFPALAGFAWQAGYGAFSVSRSRLQTVTRYIERQAERHRTRTFQEEYRELLVRHGIAFDERYVWD